MLRAAVLGTSLACATSTSQLTVQVKRDGSLIMPHSLPDGRGMGQRGLDRRCSFPQSTRRVNFVSHQKRVWTFSVNMAEPTSGGDCDGPCITGAPVDELVQAVVTTPQRGDHVKKPTSVGSKKKKDSWRKDAEFRIWQPPKVGGFKLAHSRKFFTWYSPVF